MTHPTTETICALIEHLPEKSLDQTLYVKNWFLSLDDELKIVTKLMEKNYFDFLGKNFKNFKFWNNEVVVKNIACQVENCSDVMPEFIDTLVDKNKVLANKIYIFGVVEGLENVVDGCLRYGLLGKVDKNDRDPLILAVRYNQKAIFDILLPLEVSVVERFGGMDIMTTEEADTLDKSFTVLDEALECACLKGYSYYVDELIKAGAKPYAIIIGNNYCDSNLMYAVRSGDINCVKYLLKAGANIDHKNTNGCTALSKAVVDCNLDMIKELISNGADVNSVDNNGYTPLMSSLEVYGSINHNVVKEFLNSGANVNVTAKDGMTPIKLALKHSRNDMVQLLTNHQLLTESVDSQLVVDSTSTAVNDIKNIKDIKESQELSFFVKPGSRFDLLSQQSQSKLKAKMLQYKDQPCANTVLAVVALYWGDDCSFQNIIDICNHRSIVFEEVAKFLVF